MEDSVPWGFAIGLGVALSLLMVGVGVIVVNVANRAADGRLARNGWAGIRTSATRSSDEAWLAAHQAGRDATVLGGWLAGVTGVVPLIVGLALGALGIIDGLQFTAIYNGAILVGAFAMTAAIVVGGVKGHRAAKAIAEAT